MYLYNSVHDSLDSVHRVSEKTNYDGASFCAEEVVGYEPAQQDRARI